MLELGVVLLDYLDLLSGSFSIPDSASGLLSTPVFDTTMFIASVWSVFVSCFSRWVVGLFGVHLMFSFLGAVSFPALRSVSLVGVSGAPSIFSTIFSDARPTSLVLW